MLAERQLKISVTSSFRPKPACQVAPKQPDGEPSPLLLHFYEAALRDLTDSARSRPSECCLIAGLRSAKGGFRTHCSAGTSLPSPSRCPEKCSDQDVT